MQLSGTSLTASTAMVPETCAEFSIIAVSAGRSSSFTPLIKPLFSASKSRVLILLCAYAANCVVTALLWLAFAMLLMFCSDTRGLMFLRVKVGMSA